ncbi:MAG: 2-phospho-L-lactate transferase [Actinobacteria bacterium]|nr:2-phospho-L-lactate transferase [Actinomycetota bacterium]
MKGPVVVLAGGTGGAKLARGMLDVVGAEDLVVVANTGDDVEIYGAHVSPDQDLVSFWLGDLIDERGWGLANDSFNVMDALRSLGREIWFNLGDRDLAIGLERARMLAVGERPTEAHARITRRLGIGARVLPMSDHPVRTRVLAAERWWSLQEFMIRAPRGCSVQDVIFQGVSAAAPTPEVSEAIASARAVIIGPSNPVISIGPILALPGLRTALHQTPAPVVAVSPIVAGQVLKGPTAAFMSWAGEAASTAGVAALYDRLLDGLVADERIGELPVLETDLLMSTPQARRRLAGETLDFADALACAR